MSTRTPRDAPSPCIAICTMDPETDLCRGCYRTLPEIGGWMMMSQDDRRQVLERVAERRTSLGADTIETAREKARQARRESRRRTKAQNR